MGTLPTLWKKLVSHHLHLTLQYSLWIWDTFKNYEFQLQLNEAATQSLQGQSENIDKVHQSLMLPFKNQFKWMQVSQTMLQSNPLTITNVLGENSSKEMKFVIVAFMHSQWSSHSNPTTIFPSCFFVTTSFPCWCVFLLDTATHLRTNTPLVYYSRRGKKWNSFKLMLETKDGDVMPTITLIYLI